MSFRATVLVYEFFTGGGCPPGDLPPGLSAEALGMLWALLRDFRRWGAVQTITAIDPRFEEQVPGLNRNTLPADQVVTAQPGHEEIFRSLLKGCDAAILIAPETDGILARLTAQAEEAGIPVLGSSAFAVAAAADKSVCHRLFREAHLPTPDTHVVSFVGAVQTAREMDFPLVVKPIDGIGCEGVCRVDRYPDFAEALNVVRRATRRDELLLQSFAEGIHASASILIAGGQCVPLSLNRQLIEAGSPFIYLGSEVPIEFGNSFNALQPACTAVKLIHGMKGYAGVDLILKQDAVELVEINPRITTSYIGLRQVAQINLAQAIWEACMNGVLPDQVPLEGRITIRKDDPASWALGRPA